MRKPNSGDEQTQSRQAGVRRKQGADQHQSDSDGPKALGRAGIRIKDQPQRVDRTLRTGLDSIGGALTGGILRQLIGKTDGQLARLDDRLAALEQERQLLEHDRKEMEQEREQLQLLLNDLQQSVQENPLITNIEASTGDDQ